MINNLYTNVQYHGGNQNYSTVEDAKVLTNQREYFAELTETYFRINDFFPFVKSDVQNYDPVGFEMIAAAWEQQY